MFGVNLDLKFLIIEIGEAQEVSLSPIPIPFLIHRSCFKYFRFFNSLGDSRFLRFDLFVVSFVQHVELSVIVTAIHNKQIK
jgi:hypothetical protein